MTAAVAFLGDRLLAIGCDRLLLASQLRFSRLYVPGNTADVLIFGDSRAVNTFYTPSIREACGLSALNLGYNGCSTDLAAMLLEDSLARNFSPKLVVVEVSSALQGNELLKSLKIYAGLSPRVSEAVSHYTPTVAQATRLVHLYRFNSEMFLRALYYIGRDDQAWINRYTIGQALLEEARSQRSMPVPLAAASSRNVEALSRIRKLCADRGIRLLLVLGPYMPLYRDRLTGVDQWITQLEAAVGLPVVDLSAAIDDHACFADNLHLNNRGADALIPQIERLFRTAIDSPPPGL